MELKGIVELVKFGLGNDQFQKSELILETSDNPQYPQFITIEFGGNKSSLIDSFEKGDSVKISINLNGRKWTNPQGETKYFNSVQGWKIEKNII